MIKCLKLEAIFLWLLQGRGCGRLSARALLHIQSELLGNIFVLHLLLILRARVLFVHRVRFRLNRLLLLGLALYIRTLVLVLVLVQLVCGAVGVRRGRFLVALILSLQVHFYLRGVHVFLLLRLL